MWITLFTFNFNFNEAAGSKLRPRRWACSSSVFSLIRKLHSLIMLSFPLLPCLSAGLPRILDHLPDREAGESGRARRRLRAEVLKTAELWRQTQEEEQMIHTRCRAAEIPPFSHDFHRREKTFLDVTQKVPFLICRRFRTGRAVKRSKRPWLCPFAPFECSASSF